MMLYKNMKAIVQTPNGNINFFDNILQENTFATFLLIIFLDYES